MTIPPLYSRKESTERNCLTGPEQADHGEDQIKSKASIEVGMQVLLRQKGDDGGRKVRVIAEPYEDNGDSHIQVRIIEGRGAGSKRIINLADRGVEPYNKDCWNYRKWLKLVE